MNRTMIETVAMGAALGISVGVGCRYDDTDHCAVEDGNAYCVEKYGGSERTFCARGNDECQDRFPTEAHDGCVMERPSDDACYSPCGGRKSIAQDAECEGVAETTSSGNSGSETDASSEPTGGPTTGVSVSESETESASSSTAPSGCTSSADCVDAASPICVDMACVACSSDEECGAKDPAMPACREDGQCVACTASNVTGCVDTTPVCDVAANACVGCRFHEECAGTACDIATGACFSDACVVEVDGDGGADYEEIQDAIVDGCVVIVHELDGGGVPYIGALEVDGATVALLAAPGEQPIVQGTGGNPSLSLTTSATVYVQGLTFSQNSAEGIAANASALYLDRTRVVANTAGGVVLSNDAYGQFRNCFVGGDVNNVAALAVLGSTANILYTTVGAGFGDATALQCNAAATVDVRNSFFVASTDDPEVACTTDTFDGSVTEADVGDMNTSWFAGYATGNFHLTGAAPDEVLSAAQWQVGDPATDIDGDARPTEARSSDVAGADIP